MPLSPSVVFELDSQIRSTCLELGDSRISQILLKNNAEYPWLIMVPRVANIQELDQIPTNLRKLFMEELCELSSLMRNYFKPDKLNIGTLGNIVPQLHIHLVARFKHDSLWPHGVWQADLKTTAYAQEVLDPMLADLRSLITESSNFK